MTATTYKFKTSVGVWLISTTHENKRVRAADQDLDVQVIRATCGHRVAYLWNFTCETWNFRTNPPYGDAPLCCVFNADGQYVARSTHQGEALVKAWAKL